MAHVYFHCSNAERLVVDPRGVDVDDMIEAHQRAVRIVRTFIDSHGPDDWREWTLHVADDEGIEIFLMPFASVVGRLH